MGPGPLWELLEDRGWYKEAIVSDAELGGGVGVEKEVNRRPRVHGDVKVEDGLQVLNPEFVFSQLGIDCIMIASSLFILTGMHQRICPQTQ